MRILRWKEKYDQIPEDTRDPGLLKAKKALKKKKPTRARERPVLERGAVRATAGRAAGQALQQGADAVAAAGLPAEDFAGDVRACGRCCASGSWTTPRLAASEKALDRMLLTLADRGFVTLDPPPPPEATERAEPPTPTRRSGLRPTRRPSIRSCGRRRRRPWTSCSSSAASTRCTAPSCSTSSASPTATNASRRWKACWKCRGRCCATSACRGPTSCRRGRWQTTRLDADLIRAASSSPRCRRPEEEEEDDEEEEEYPPTLADKLRLLFDALHPDVADVHTQPVWAAGELLRFNGNFNLYVRTRDLVKQEGIVFRHLLRLILLCGEFAQVTPPDADAGGMAGGAARLGRPADGQLPRGRSGQHRR